MEILQMLHLIVYLVSIVCFIIVFIKDDGEDNENNIKQMIFFGVMAILNEILIFNR